MTYQNLKKVLISAGGTGGHIFPALALTNELRANGVEVEWIGTADRMEATLAPKYGIPIHFIKISGVVSRGIKAYLQAPFKVVTATSQATKILKEFKPDVVITMGGYVVGPVGLAAKICGIPLIIHEQNSVMGLTNKILRKVANKTLTAFPLPGIPEENVVGQPLRKDFNDRDEEANLAPLTAKVAKEYALLKDFYQQKVLSGTNNAYQEYFNADTKVKEALAGDYSSKNFNILYGNLSREDKLLFNKESFNTQPAKIFSVGGSLGAKILNETLVPALNKVQRAGYNFSAHQQCGKDNSQAVLELAKDLGVANFSATDFVDDMLPAYQEADLVLCRSGAITVFEIAAVNRMAIFVPFPGHKDKQQSKNAHYLADQDAAIVIEQTHFNADFLATHLKALNYHSLYQRAKKQSALASPKASAKIVAIADQVVGAKRAKK